MEFRNILLSLVIIFSLSACKRDVDWVNYEEEKVPDYTLPDALKTADGKKVSSLTEWRNTRRPELLELFASEMYGEFPSLDYRIDFKEKTLADDYFENTAIVKEILANVTTDYGSKSFSILYVYPKDLKNVPVFAGLNFMGNHTLDTLSTITVHSEWIRNSQQNGISNNTATSESRGISASRWPLRTIIENGYGVATVYYGEIDPDFDDGFNNGFHPLFLADSAHRDEHSAATISMWAKGMSFIADYLESDSVADPTRIIAIGHSRLGKTSLWAGANDERFSAVISNNSGCGGAALSRREFGERVIRINTVFPHWFCDRFKTYNKRVNKLPVDQHMLLALMAPRPVYVASATEDQWADPRGEFLALKEASKVYQLAGSYVFPDEMPAPDKPIHLRTAYHLRTGKHNITEYDWIMYMKWADKWLSN